MEADLIPKEQAYRKLFHDKEIEAADYFTRAARRLYEKDIASILMIRGEKPSTLVLVDDLNTPITNQTVNDMKIKIAEACFEEKIDMEFALMLSSDFWRHFIGRSSQIFEIMRSSYIMYDKGFVTPLQELFVKGKIRPSKESRNVFFVKAEKDLKNATTHMNAAMIDIYWAVVDVAHAAVMVAGITPPSPKDLAETLKKEIISRKLIHERCADIMEKVYDTAKDIMHKKKWKITGQEYDEYKGDAEFFISEVTRFIKQHHGYKEK